MANRIQAAVLPSLPRAAGNVSNRDGNEPHTAYLIQRVYTRNEGKLQLPVMGEADDESQECRIVNLHSPVGMLLVYWVAARNRLLPELPDMDPGDPNEVLAGWIIGAVAPGIKIDTVTYEFGISGVYAYYLRKPPSKKAGVKLGRLPYDKNAGRVLRQTNFSQHHRG